MTTYHTLRPVPSERIEDVMRLFSQAWWTAAYPRELVEQMLAGGCATVGLLDDAGVLVGFGRAISDGVFKALLVDVIVAEDLRGHGVGHQLVEALLACPEVATVLSAELYCHPRHVPWYSEHGFVLQEDAFMQRPASVSESTGQ